ncbi:nucleotide exchange factor GrpE [Patescibacteria group bacterium]|nr:nucleotide exchange factor GrpE [Patescibacteria group bacterium]
MDEQDKPQDDIQPQAEAQPEEKPATDWENVAKRALADLDNYKKQQDKLRGEMTQFMSMALLTRILDIYEDLKRMLAAIQNTKLDPATIPAEVVTCQKGAMDGVVNILKKFTEVFKAEGLEPIEVKPGDKFDPATMEAISHEEHDEHKDDAVIEQFEAGLKYQDRVLKPAKVRVGK